MRVREKEKKMRAIKGVVFNYLPRQERELGRPADPFLATLIYRTAIMC